MGNVTVGMVMRVLNGMMMMGMEMIIMQETLMTMTMMMKSMQLFTGLTQVLVSATNVTVPYRKGTSHEWLRQSQR